MSKKKKQEMKEPPTNRNILWITYAMVLAVFRAGGLYRLFSPVSGPGGD